MSAKEGKKKFETKCHCCGHIRRAYIHSINYSLVSALKKFVAYYEKVQRPIGIQREMDFTHNQMDNFQKLRYFGLVKMVKGGWEPTELGKLFVYGATTIPSQVATIEKVPLRYDHPIWEDKTVTMKGVNDYWPKEYKTREEYLADSQGALFYVEHKQ